MMEERDRDKDFISYVSSDSKAAYAYLEHKCESSEIAVNKIIKDDSVNTNKISDGYHTFGELYDHRITLYIALLRSKAEEDDYTRYDQDTIWRSKAHSDGSVWEGWFILGMFKEAGEQITYHLPIDKWDDCDFADELEKAPEWDGHTSDDVLKRIARL